MSHVLVLCVCVFCNSFLCSISLLLSDFLSCILNSVQYYKCDCSCIWCTVPYASAMKPAKLALRRSRGRHRMTAPFQTGAAPLEGA